MTRGTPTRALVIGAGVNGLSCAMALLSAGVEVELWTREPTAKSTSAVSAAFWYPFAVGPEAGVHRWSRDALRDFLNIQELSEAHGVAMHRVVELFPERVDAPGWREILSDLREAEAHELRRGRKAGWVFSAPVIDTSLYLPWLKARVLAAGGRIHLREAKSLDEALSHCPTVINTSGLGAARFTPDPGVYPVRGELVRTGPLHHASAESFGVWLDEHGPEIRYIVPRNGDTILGGTFEPERTDTELDPATAKEIKEGCAQLVPELAEMPIVEHKLGWRPAREEVRLELEERIDGRVVHNYGHGGAGVTLSWGCARAVLETLGLVSTDRPWDGPAANPQVIGSRSAAGAQ